MVTPLDGNPTWKVRPDGRAWIVEERGRPDVRSRHKDRDAAVREARLLALENAPSYVVVHDEDGRVVWAVVFSGNGHDGTDGIDLLTEDGDVREAIG